jgi:hypothetical protein
LNILQYLNVPSDETIKKLITKKTTVLNAEDGTSFILHEPQLIDFLSREKKEVLLSDNDRQEDFILEVGSYSIEHDANNNIFSLIRKSN